MIKTCAVMGQRPTRFKFKYNEDYSLCKKIKKVMAEEFKRLYDEEDVRRILVGGTLGVDMWAGEIVLRLKETPGYENFELIVVLPFAKIDEHWDSRSQKRLAFLIRHSEQHLIVGENSGKESYIKRNHYMMEHADYLLAVSDSGCEPGSAIMKLVNYSTKEKMYVVMIHPDTAKICRVSCLPGCK